MFSHLFTSNSEGKPRINPFIAWGVAVVLTFVPFLLINIWVAKNLFDYESYTNSASFDESWRSFTARNDWKIVAFGNSEVRWGINPAPIEQQLADKGIQAPMFNIGIDGALDRVMIPFLQLDHHAPNLRIAIIGAQLSEYYDVISFENPSTREQVCNSALQKPVISSAFARDTGLNQVCLDQDPLIHTQQAAEGMVPIFEYRSSVRNFLLGFARGRDGFIPFDSGALEPHENGWGPHKSISEHYENFRQGWERVQQEKSDGHPNYQPLKDGEWATLLKPGHYYEEMADWFLERQVLPVFVALPTNPILIDLRERRQNYLDASKLLQAWAAEKGVVFIDLGIQDQLDPSNDFADRRHLSRYGAERFSLELARQMSKRPEILAALR